jgi:hypothetical protein
MPARVCAVRGERRPEADSLWRDAQCGLESGAGRWRLLDAGCTRGCSGRRGSFVRNVVPQNHRGLIRAAVFVAKQTQ